MAAGFGRGYWPTRNNHNTSADGWQGIAVAADYCFQSVEGDARDVINDQGTAFGVTGWERGKCRARTARRYSGNVIGQYRT
jgi:hypothetical protein